MHTKNIGALCIYIFFFISFKLQMEQIKTYLLFVIPMAVVYWQE